MLAGKTNETPFEIGLRDKKPCIIYIKSVDEQFRHHLKY